MKTKLPERIGMPTVSNMAHKVLSNRPDYHKIKECSIKPINEMAYKATLEELRQAKQNLGPNLKELKQALDDANEAYIVAYDEWNEVASEYERLDRQERMLIHEQTVASKANKPKETKPKSPKDSNKQAMKFIANLSPEKLAELLTLIQKQTS